MSYGSVELRINSLNTTHILSACCGVGEIWGISDWDISEFKAEIVLKEFWRQITQGFAARRGFFYFTDKVSECDEDGPRLVILRDYIRENNLGVTTLTPSTPNPQSSRTIQMLVFAPDYEAIRDWYAKLTAPPLDQWKRAKESISA